MFFETVYVEALQAFLLISHKILDSQFSFH
nr:MAG TPA: hypothetical protein [Bacteriophage sp.]